MLPYSFVYLGSLYH